MATPMCPLYLVSFVNRFASFDGRGGRGSRGMLPGFVLSDAAQARHRNYAEADLTEKAKRGCVSPASTGEEKRRGLLPGFVLSDAAQARHRNYAVADLTEKAKRGCVSQASTERGSRGGHVARLRSVGCRAGAAPELRRGRFNRKGEARMRFAFSVKSGGAYRGRTDDLLHAMQAL